MQRIEITNNRIFGKVTDLVEVHKTTMYSNKFEKAQVSWASTSNKPDAAGAYEFAAAIQDAAAFCEAIDRAIRTPDDLKNARIRQTDRAKTVFVFTKNGQVIISVPATCIIYAPNHEIEQS